MSHPQVQHSDLIRFKTHFQFNQEIWFNILKVVKKHFFQYWTPCTTITQNNGGVFEVLVVILRFR
jgi:hypothetical protein